ncbi:MAG TPA: hypothetical protein VMH27_04935 [Puia sp.]|nr:hypothetical protein [Puia sp.]
MSNPHSRVRIVPILKRKKVGVPVSAPQEKEKVEVFEGDVPAPPANARLTYNGGALIQNVTVYTIFWGSGWAGDAAMKTVMAQVNQFFTDILVSPLIDQLSEYNVSGKYTIGHGSLAGTIVITDGAPGAGSTIEDAAVQTTLTGWINAGRVPGTTPNMLYFIYFDKGVVVSMEGGSSCSDFCGYHDAIGGNTYYAVMPYPSCDGCLAGLSAIDALTGTSSHELCEAITDPVPPNGWYDQNNNMEIGDLCAWTFKKVGGHNVQLEWSNKANKCI